RDRRRFFRTAHALGPEIAGAVGPAVDFFYFADEAGFDPFDLAADVFGSVAGVAHLRGDFVFARGFGEGSDFRDIVAEGLFAIDVLSEQHRRHRSSVVRVV